MGQTEWHARMKEALPRQDIPTFLVDLQGLVQALRDGQPWQGRITPILKEHAALAIAYLQPGSKRDAVAAFLNDKA